MITLAIVSAALASAEASTCQLSLDEVQPRFEAIVASPIESDAQKTDLTESLKLLLADLDSCESHYYSLGGPPDQMTPSEERSIVARYDQIRDLLGVFIEMIQKGDSTGFERFVLHAVGKEAFSAPAIIALDCRYHGEQTGCDA